MKKSPAIVALALAATLAPSFAAAQQDWPSRPIRMVVGFGPGGGTDIVARIVAQPLGEALGQSVVVENRPGAGGAVAAAQVAKAAPDGYTAFMLNNGFAVSAVMRKSLPYDPLGDFQPIAMVATMPLLVLTGPNSGFSDVKGLVDSAKAAPGKLNFANVGLGSTQHFAGELLLQLARIQLLPVPYKGTPLAVAATSTNESQLLVEVAGPVLGQVKGGALKALAVTSATRFSGLPRCPRWPRPACRATTSRLGTPWYSPRRRLPPWSRRPTARSGRCWPEKTCGARWRTRRSSPATPAPRRRCMRMSGRKSPAGARSGSRPASPRSSGRQARAANPPPRRIAAVRRKGENPPLTGVESRWRAFCSLA